MKRREAIKSFISASILPFIPFGKLFASEDCLTTSDILGPYFIEGAPNLTTIAPQIDNIPRLFITGTVYAKDCVTPVPNALIDVWQANDEGAYEDLNYRGKMYTDEAGNYAFESIQPGKYLNGTYYRPSHIHYKVQYLNNPEFITQLYFEGDTSIDEDPWASSPSATDRIIPLSTDENGNLNGVFDMYLDIDSNTINLPDYNRNDLSTRIISISPNPISEHFEIQFYCRESSEVSIDVCDVMGRNQMVLFTQNCSKNVHKISLKKPKLAAGIYVIRLAINGHKVDAKRILIK